MKRIAIFVDVQNIYYTTRQAYGRQFNYRRLWQCLSTEGRIVAATAYATQRDDDKQIKFQDALKHIGFRVTLKPWIQRSDGSAKGDWDVGITLDMIEFAKEIDVAVLASGDGDFDLVVRKLRDAHEVEVEVYGVRELTADSLIQAATRFVPIEGRLLLSR